MKKYNLLKRFAALLLRQEIIEANERKKALHDWIEKLENAIVDQDKTVLLQAYYGVAKRRDQEIELKFGRRKLVSKEDPLQVWTVPIEVILTDIINKDKTE